MNKKETYELISGSPSLPDYLIPQPLQESKSTYLGLLGIADKVLFELGHGQNHRIYDLINDILKTYDSVLASKIHLEIAITPLVALKIYFQDAGNDNDKLLDQLWGKFLYSILPHVTPVLLTIIAEYCYDSHLLRSKIVSNFPVSLNRNIRFSSDGFFKPEIKAIHKVSSSGEKLYSYADRLLFNACEKDSSYRRALAIKLYLISVARAMLFYHRDPTEKNRDNLMALLDAVPYYSVDSSDAKTVAPVTDNDHIPIVFCSEKYTVACLLQGMKEDICSKLPPLRAVEIQLTNGSV